MPKAQKKCMHIISMNGAQALIAFALVAILAVSSYIIPAFSHGVNSCLTSHGGCALAKNNEQYSSFYSNETVNMDDGSGGVLTITGTLHNKYYNTELVVVPYLSVDASQSNPFGSSELNNLLRLSYPLYNDPTSWYFRAESNLTNPVVLKPREEVNYEIKVYPLKAGEYHVHSNFVFDYLNDGRYRYYQSPSGGAPVTVIGTTTQTMGEVTQLILPFAIGGAAIPIMIFRTRTVARNESNSSAGAKRSKLRLGIRLYFAVKSSLETVWLAGLLFWFLFAAYPAFHSLESRILSMVGMIAIIAAIAAGGYVAALARSNKVQSIFAIGTSIASVFVYFLMNQISYYLFFSDGGASFYYDLLPTSGTGFGYNQFGFYGPLPLIALVTNSAVAMLSVYLIEKRKTSKILTIGLGILAFSVILIFR